MSSCLSEAMGLALTSNEVEKITERTKGRLMGLQLFALSLQGQTPRSEVVTHASGGQRDILDYLTQEVLSQQPERLQRFLLITSVLDGFCASLCDALWDEGESQQMLEMLERRHLFVVALDGEVPSLISLLQRSREQHRSLYREQLLTAFGQREQRVRKESGPASPVSHQALIDPLSAREQEVLELMAQGASNQEIAQALVITLNTVKRHVQTILEKLGVRNRTQAVIRAQQLHLLAEKLTEA